MVERRGLFLARKRLGLIWRGDLPWLNSLVVAKKPKSKKTKEIPWPNIRQSCISCSVMSPGMSFAPSWSATKATKGCGSCRAGGSSWRFFSDSLTGQHSLRDLVTT